MLEGKSARQAPLRNRQLQHLLQQFDGGAAIWSFVALPARTPELQQLLRSTPTHTALYDFKFKRARMMRFSLTVCQCRSVRQPYCLTAQ